MRYGDPCITRNARGDLSECETEQCAGDTVWCHRDFSRVLNGFSIFLAVGVDVDEIHRFVAGDIVGGSQLFHSAVDNDALHLHMTSHEVVLHSAIVPNCNSK